jgi:hypothetical protein
MVYVIGYIIDKIISFFDFNKPIILPNLPCVVFKNYTAIITIVIILLVALLYLWANDIEFIFQCALLLATAIVTAIIYRSSLSDVKGTYLTSTNVRIKFGNGLQRTFSLDKYAFYLSIWNVRGSMKSYVYRIHLIECNKADSSVIINSLTPLRDILKPADLSKYVEHIQQQLPERLEIVFKDKKVRDEYYLKDFIR